MMLQHAAGCHSIQAAPVLPARGSTMPCCHHRRLVPRPASSARQPRPGLPVGFLPQAAGAAGSAGTEAESPLPPSRKPGLFSTIYKSLRDFGIGKRSLVEGSLGLFLLGGGALSLALVLWARGSALRKGRPYLAYLEFPQACGITVGTPLRIRGVQVGSVLNVRPSLERVEVLVEVGDTASVIPLNSVVEANQSGLIAEPLVDITPQLPVPEYTAHALDPGCQAEGQILCHNGRMQGIQGVAMDDLVYIMTRMARQMEAYGLNQVLTTAETAQAALEEAKPLLAQATLLAQEITPLLQELRETGLVGNLDGLTAAAAGAAGDIQRLQAAILTEDNVRALRSSVVTLCKTLENIESVSADASVFSRDAGVQRNLRALVQALSRIVED